MFINFVLLRLRLPRDCDRPNTNNMDKLINRVIMVACVEYKRLVESLAHGDIERQIYRTNNIIIIFILCHYVNTIYM